MSESSVISDGSARVINARYVTSVCNVKDVREFDYPEVAFLGRSNVGKSTLLNALCGQNKLAKTSKTPGRTAALNYFEVNLAYSNLQGEPQRVSAYFVDVPGYGFAKVSKREQARWGKLLEEYLFQSKSLQGLLLLHDGRREIRKEELWIRSLGEQRDFAVVLTKTDKLKKAELQKARREVKSALELEDDELFTTGVVGKKKVGLGLLAQRVCEIVLA